MLIKGAVLTLVQRRLVLAAFGYRWTADNAQRVQWWSRSVPDRSKWPRIPLVSDNQWLAEHAFHFTKDGKRLMANRHHAEPHYLAA